MKNNKNIVIGAVAVLAIVFCAAYLKQTTVNVSVPTSVPQAPGVGAMSGNFLDSGYFTQNGQQYYRERRGFATSTALCSFLNPFAPATTTVIYGGTGLTLTNITGTNTFDVSTSSTAYGSSTPAFARAVSVASGAQLTYQFTPRFGTTTATTAFDPANGGIWQIADAVNANYPYQLTGSQYLTFRVATGTPGVGALQGACNFYGVRS